MATEIFRDEEVGIAPPAVQSQVFSDEDVGIQPTPVEPVVSKAPAFIPTPAQTPAPSDVLSARQIRKADLASQQEAISREEAPFVTKLATRGASGLEKGMTLPERAIRGGLDILGYYKALDAVLGTGTKYQDQNQSWLKYFNERESQLEKEDEALGAKGFGYEVAEGATRAVAELPLQLLGGATGAARGAAVKGAALAAGLTSGLSQVAQDRGEGRSQLDSAIYGAVSGTITGLTTAAFGGTGVESVFSREGVKGVGNRILQVLKQSGLEGAEEAVDQFQQDLLERVARNPGKPIGDSVKEILLAGSVGALIGGAASSVHNAAEFTGEKIQEKRESDVFDKAIEQNAKRVATMGTMPELAQRGVRRLPRPETPEGAIMPEVGTRVQRAIRQRQEAGIVPEPVMAEVPAPKPEWLVNITPPETLRGKQLPAAIQVDMMDGDVNRGSTNPNELRARGVAFPSQEDLLKLPKGKYTLDQVQKMLTPPTAKPEPISSEVVVEPKIAEPAPVSEAKAGTPSPEIKEPVVEPPPVLKGGVPSEVQEKVQGEAGVLTPETPAAVSPGAAASVQKKSTPRSDSQEFDRLLAEHGMERDWVTDPDGFYADIGKYGDTASIEGNKKKSKAYQAARRRAAIDIGLTPNDVDTIQGRAKALSKLKEYLAKLNEPDVQEDKETGSTDFLPAGEAIAAEPTEAQKEAGKYSVENPPKLYEKVRWKGEDGEVTTAVDGSGKVRFQSFTWDNFVTVNELERIEETKPLIPKVKPVAKLSSGQLKRLSVLVKKQRAADEGGKALTPEETQELEALRAVGQEDLIAEPTGANEAAERGEIARLRAKAKELRRQAQLAQQRWVNSRVTEVANKHRADANNLEKEAIATENDADRREFKLKQAGAEVKPSGDFGLESETEKKDDDKDDKGPPPGGAGGTPDLFGPRDASIGERAETEVQFAGTQPMSNAALRRKVNDPNSGVPSEMVRYINALLDSGLTNQIPGLSWAIDNAIHGGATGEYLPDSRLARFSTFAESTTPIHEFFHDVWYFLKPEDQAEIRKLREQAIQKELNVRPRNYAEISALENMLKEGVTSDDFIKGNLPSEVYHLSNEREFFTWLMTDRAAKHFDSKPEAKSFIGRIKDVLQKLWTTIKDAVGLSPKADALWRKILAGKYEFTPQEGREFEARELARPEPLKQAVEMFERKAAVDPAAARRAVEIGQAANVLARQGMVQWTLTNLEGIARGEAATPQQKWLRDLAAKVLANPFIRNALRRPVERLNASARYTGDTIETYQTLKSKPDATPEQVSNASGEAVNDIVSWEQRVADFNSAYLAKRQTLANGIAKTAEAEMEAYDKLDAADVLLSDFRSMALPILRQSNDTTALQAYTYALGRSQAVRNVLAWVGREVDLTGASTPADVLNLIREAGGRSRIQESIEQQIGAERGVIQAVSRIIALVEPIRERLQEARFLYRQQAGTRSTELKQRLERLVAQGSYARALEVFERGAEKLGAEQDRARRELDFYARRTRQQLLALRALDEVKAISERISSDPGFQAEKREVFGESAQNVRNVMVDIRGSTFVLKPFGGMTEELHLTFGNPTAQSRASLEQIKTYRDRAMAYIASENADPSVAQGLKATMPLLEQFLNPAVSPEAERLLPNFMLKGFHALLRRIGAPERIPYYLLQGAGGTWKAVADATLRARRDMGEQLQRINKAHFPKMSLALHAALKSHGEITPDTYFEKVWNHLAGSRQNFRDIRYLNEGDPIGNGEKVTKEDLAFLEAYRKFHTDLSATSQNIGKRQFSSFRSVLTGIFFDKDGRVRLPFAQGVDMVNRRQPPQYEIEDWLNKWRAAKTPDAKSEFLTDYLDRLVIGYMHGVNQADWVRKFPYSYEVQIREILEESAEQPIDSFGTLVDRVFEKVTVEENEVPPTWEDVRNNLLFDFDSIFKKLERLDTTQKQTDPKNIVETVRSEREFNTERGDVIMPPNWYDYGGVTEGQWSSVSRASMFPYERAHLVAINGIKDALSAVVKDFEQQSKSRNEGFRGYFRTKRESRKARELGELIYSWADAKELLDKVTHYAAGLKMMAEQPQLLTQTDRPYAVLQSGVTQLPVAMVLFRLGAASRNLFGGYTNALLADMAFRNRSWAISVPLRSAELVADTYKNLLTALVHEGNPVGRKIHSLLSSASSRAVIGPIAENFLKSIDEQRQLYRDAAELGLNLNVALWDSLSTLRKFAKTAGNVREPGSPLERIYSVPAAALRMGGMVFGQAGVGKIDSWINTKAYIQARQYEQIYKKMARKYGEQVISMGLDQFPPNAFGGSYKAVKVREFFTRMAGLDIDAAMRDYYKRWSESGTDADGDLVPLFTEEQRNTLAVATADDFNLATFSNRPYSTKMHSMLNTLGLFYGYPDWWIHKLLSTANLNSRKGLTEGRLENMPFLLNYALLFALASIMGMEGVEWLKEWLLNQKSAYPTLTDAKTAPAAVRAAAGAVAFNTPFIGGAVSSAFDLGYHGSNNPYDLFFIPGMLKAAANVGVETWQTGEPVLPMMKFADRYLLPVPSHKLTDATAGSRALVNTGNILEMSARANDDEEKLKPRDAAGFQRDYTPATPIVTRAMNAIGNGDMPEFQKEYNALVQEYRRQGKSDPERNARQSLMTRNPISQRFAKRPTEAEFAKYLDGLTETERKIVTDTLNNYRQAMGIIGAAPSFTAGEARGGGGGSTSFRPTGSAAAFATAATGAPARFSGSRVRSALSTSRSRYPRRVRGVRTRLTAARRRPRRVSRIRTSRVRRAKLPRFSTRIRRPRRIRISPRRQFV